MSLGDDLKALRDRAIAKGMRLLTLEEINADIPQGYKLVCEKCGADHGDKCGWPSNCPTGQAALDGAAKREGQ